jgi:ATP-dependent Clp protease adapter protein ClpS
MRTSPVLEPIVEQDQAARTRRPWIVILYNDDWHPYDAVVFQVQKATGCSLEEAEWITYEAHTTGRAIAYTGTMEECERVATVLREIRLQVETDAA